MKPHVHAEHTTPRKPLLVCAAVACAAVSVLAFGCSYEDQPPVDRAITEDVDSVVISADDAKINVRTHEGTKVEIETTANRGGKPTVTSTMKGRTLEIKGGCDGGFFCRATINVVVPVGVRVTADTDAGDIDLNGSPGQVSLRTDAGDIDVSLESAVDAFSATTDVGDIDIDVPAGRYAVDADTDVGGVDVQGMSGTTRRPQRSPAEATSETSPSGGSDPDAGRGLGRDGSAHRPAPVSVTHGRAGSSHRSSCRHRSGSRP